MHFSDYPYTRPIIADFRHVMHAQIEQLRAAQTLAEILPIMDAIDALKATIQTNETLTRIRHSIDTRDAFYKRENDFWDENHSDS